jgi:peptide/nickel transport system permease protein
MLAFIVRRLAFGFATVLGVLFVLFVLFFAVADPDDMAIRAIGERASPETYAAWKRNHGYDKPLLINPEYDWTAIQRYTDTLLVDHYERMLSFRFGRSDSDDTPIWTRIREGAGPSLSLTLPLFILGLIVGITLSLFVAFFRGTYIDRSVLVICMLGMSVASLIYIIGGQYLIGKLLRWFPISGFDPDPSVIARFLAIPILIGVLAEFGGTVRLYRTVFLEEVNRDYVRTRAAARFG